MEDPNLDINLELLDEDLLTIDISSLFDEQPPDILCNDNRNEDIRTTNIQEDLKRTINENDTENGHKSKR